MLFCFQLISTFGNMLTMLIKSLMPAGGRTVPHLLTRYGGPVRTPTFTFSRRLGTNQIEDMVN